MSMRVFDVILKALAIKPKELKNQGLSYLVLQFHMFGLMGPDPLQPYWECYLNQ